jgi:phosphoglycolate phosphatase-like HAD superfamily hydrolase
MLFACSGQVRTDKIVEQNPPSTNLDTLPDLKKIVVGIEKGNRVESSHIGYGGSPSSQWDKYEQLKKVATNDQLISLTDHKNSAVRCYAFQALAAKRSDKIFTVLINHLNDTSIVHTQNGCIGMSQLTGDYFVDVVTLNYIEIDSYKLNPAEKKILDSILLNDKSIILSAKSSVLEALKPTTDNYERIRQLVKDDRNESALRALAKYQRQTDKELITSFFKDDNTQSSALYAVREFPDDYFYSFVVKVFEQEWKQELYDYPKWRICYQALAKYPRPETIELFDRTTKSKDEFRYETLCKYLLIAITKYPNKLYDQIKARIKLSSYQMDEVKEELENDD